MDHEHVDVLDRRRRPVRHRRGLPPAGGLPRQDLRDPRGARRARRDVGPVPLPGHPLGLRHVHARLQLPAVGGREGDRRRRRRSCATSRDDGARARRRRGASASATASCAPSGRRADARWTVEAERTDTGEAVRLTCGFLFACTGYYRYDEGYTPEFPGVERFGGRVVHPQHWPEDLDYAGKRVVVIGSGATAVTLVPALAEQAEHVTMLQRSPTYVVSLPGERPDRRPRAPRAARPRPPTRSCAGRTSRSRRCSSSSAGARPRLVRALHAARASQRSCPPGYDVDDALQAALRPVGPARLPRARRRPVPGAARRARVDRHRRGSRPSPSAACASRPGAELEADVVVTATGLNLLALGGMELAVDGARGRAARDRRLQGHDAQRRAEPRHRARLHERVVDAEVRPDLRVRLPAAEPHGRARLRGVHAAHRRPDAADAAVPRPQVGLRAALDRPVPASRASRPRGGCTRTTRATS